MSLKQLAPSWAPVIILVLAGLTSLWQPAMTHGQLPPADEPLKLGQLIERVAKANERQRYTLAEPPDHYLHLIVRQRGVRLTATVLTPGGERIASGDRANQMHGPKSIHLITSAHSVYTLEIQTTDIAQTGGSYSVQLVAARPAGERERDLVAAQTAFSTAFALASQPQAAARRQGQEKYPEALRLFRAAGDQEGEALTLTELGLVTNNLAEPRRAIEWYRQALPIWQTLGDQYGEARVLGNLGVSHSRLGELQEARNYYQQSLVLWQATGDRNGEARMLNNLGAIHFLLGEWQASLSCSQQALAIWREAGDYVGMPFALNSLGLLYFELGDQAQALNQQQEVLKLARTVKPRVNDLISIEARALNNIGEIYIAQRDETQALRYLNEALALRQQITDKQGLAMTLTNLGFVHGFAGRKTEALANYEAALALARETEYRFVEATLLKKLGELLSLSEPDRAREYFRGALAFFQNTKEIDAQAEVLHGLARLERAHNNPGAARAHLEAALALAEGLRTKVGSQTLRALFFARKQDYFTTYIDLLMQEHQQRPAEGLAQLALQTSERARARSLLELLAEANAEVQRGAPPELIARRDEVNAQIVRLTNRLLSLRSEKGMVAQVEAVEKEIQQQVVIYEQVQAQLRTHPRYAELKLPQPLTLAQVQALLDPQTLLLQYALGPERSYLWVVSHDALESYQLEGRAKIEAAAHTLTELMRAHEPLQNEDFAQQAARFKTVDERYWPAAARLSQLVLGPLAGKLGEKRLLIVPDGALHNIPFSALPQPTSEPEQLASHIAPQPLVLNHEIVYLPSASVLALQRREQRHRPVAQRTVAVFADPVFSADDPRVLRRNEKPMVKQPRTPTNSVKLDFATQATRAVRGASWLKEEVSLPRLQNSRGEMAAIAAFAPGGTALTAWDFAANREAALNPKLKQYRLIHFATHALLNDEHPALSGIVLSLVNRDGTPRAGFLQLHDVYNLDLAADLVVLSACQTARGQAVKGEGIIGLTRGFLHSGAQRVVSSLWKVEDTATSELMKQFYRGLLKQKLSPAAALRQAQIALWRRPDKQSPYYWSGFVLHGEWK